MIRRTLLPFLATLSGGMAFAADPPALEEVSILGDPSRVSSIPGSAHQLDEQFLERFDQGDILRVLRSVPGVYLQEEDGMGLRPNIGIRGSGTDRSSRIALLEDGVLISPAPYAGPSAYYFPTQRRMRSVEVLKGPASVSLGPRTTGGALNLLSTTVPDKRAAEADLLYGEDGFRDLHAWYGDRSEHTGWLVETVQQRSDGFKQLDGGGDTGFETSDYLGKFSLHTDSSSVLRQGVEFKLGYTSHVSDETYLGLTDEDFAATPLRRYAASQLDQMRNHHRQQQASYYIEHDSAGWRVDFTAYNNEFSRNWFKLDQVDGTEISAILEDPATYAREIAIIRAETDSPDNSLTLRNNNRSYYSRGVQTNVSLRARTGIFGHSLNAGLRVHSDQVDRFQHDDLFAMRSGELALTTSGIPGSQSNRVSEADVSAIFVEDRIDAGRLELTPGLRFEKIEMVRRDFSTTSPSRANGATRVRENEINVLIPGIGASYSLDNGLLWLGGVHRGFNPPSPGSTAAEEDSINYEFGLRYASAGLSAEAIGFYNDYDNLVGTCTASTGGGCEIGDQFDGGKATVAGVEMLVDFEAPRPASLPFTIPVRIAYTWTGEARFDNAFVSGFGPWGEVEAGDTLPYVPEHQLQLATDLVSGRWSTGLNANFVTQTRTEAGQGSIPASERLDSYWVVDLAGRYRLNQRFELFARIDNLLDEQYAVARRPAGLRPGKPRSAMLGFHVEL